MKTHYSYEDWCKYVKNELDGSTREEYENHLYSCDQCLESYLQVLDGDTTQFPVIQNDFDFTDGIMAEIADLNKQKQKVNTKKSFYQSSVFHYLIAAAMTLVLMGSGVFQSITKYADTVQNPQVLGQTPSVTEEIIEKTFTWIDSFHLQNKEAQK
ncbi:hypothetical protein ACFSO7_21980 [Bacillus sp. CGMCC 1.16607]|uniref:hypothetical protein n=1 Tax=Bacillus sp. CGMCC 1.16607 TaxID=3351842 RepID=UPI00362EE02E